MAPLSQYWPDHREPNHAAEERETAGHLRDFLTSNYDDDVNQDRLAAADDHELSREDRQSAMADRCALAEARATAEQLRHEAAHARASAAADRIDAANDRAEAANERGRNGGEVPNPRRSSRPE